MSNEATYALTRLDYYLGLLHSHEKEYRATQNMQHLHRYWVLYCYVKPWFYTDMPPIPDDLMAVIILEGWSEINNPKP